MAVGDFLGFDESAYWHKIRQDGEQCTRQREINKIRQLYGSSYKMAAGVGFAATSGGLTLVGSAIGARQWSVAHQKLEIIQDYMRENSWALHEHSVADAVIPMATCAAGLVVGHAIEIPLGDVSLEGANVAAQQGVQELAQHSISETATSAVNGTSDFVTGAAHGAMSGIEQAAAYIEPGSTVQHAGDAVMSNLIPAGASQAMGDGLIAGRDAAFGAIGEAAEYIASLATQQGLDQVIEKYPKNESSTHVTVREVVDDAPKTEKVSEPIPLADKHKTKVWIDMKDHVERHNSVIKEHRSMNDQAANLHELNKKHRVLKSGKFKKQAKKFAEVEVELRTSARASRGVAETKKLEIAKMPGQTVLVSRADLCCWTNALNEICGRNMERKENIDEWLLLHKPVKPT